MYKLVSEGHRPEQEPRCPRRLTDPEPCIRLFMASLNLEVKIRLCPHACASKFDFEILMPFGSVCAGLRQTVGGIMYRMQGTQAQSRAHQGRKERLHPIAQVIDVYTVYMSKTSGDWTIL